jgi:hypothetical protein
MLFALKATVICGLNRQVKDKAVGANFQQPFDILLKSKALQNDSDESLDEKRKGRPCKTIERPLLSGFLNEVRTFFEQIFCLQAQNPHTKK